MAVDQSVYDALYAQYEQLQVDFFAVQAQLDATNAALVQCQADLEVALDDARLEILRSVIRGAIAAIDITNPPANMATRIATFTNNLYTEMYGP